MLKTLTRWFQAPISPDDDEKTRVASLINTIAISALAIDTLVLVILPIVLPGQSGPLYRVGIAILLVIGILFLIRKGWVRIAGSFLTYGFWLITTLAVATSGGVRAPAFGTYAISVVIAGLLLGWQAVLSVCVLSILAGIAMLIAQQNGVLPPPSFPVTTASLLIAQMVNVILSGVLLGLAIRSNQAASEGLG